jgi:isopenicillin N synthase-like dioxygenase
MPALAAGSIPVINIAPLFGSTAAAAQPTDRALFAAAQDTGFVCVRGFVHDGAIGALEQGRLLTVFGLDEPQKRRLYRRKFAPENPNLYRGWFPLQPGNLTCKEGIDIGGDIAHGPGITRPDDPLREPTPVPDDHLLIGWRAAVAAYYHAMEGVAQALMRSLSRSLALPESYFDRFFARGLSTLRLIRYPARDPGELATVTDSAVWVDSDAQRRYLIGAPHTDSGFLTILAQDQVGGLQARSRDGSWTDVPPIEDTLVVNFGQVLEQWSAGRIRATEHRVLGAGADRYSIAFFYEARADATIAPLPIDPPDRFVPFQYGDFLWNRMTSFVEFRGMEGERPAGH